ncbi:MAG TPA: hypothetical protein PLW67_06855 [Prolixibacteraceae bacterium]|nr:hypothetical protein [Prolixibacteraceae bacterium]
MTGLPSCYIGNTVSSLSGKKDIRGEFTVVDNEPFYMISNVNGMPPFFISLASDSDHWMFVSSNGGITAGRKNADFALFPYYTDDKISESAEYTGSKTILLVHAAERSFLWEPFSDKYEGIYKITRNLYKSRLGNKIIFEEINHDLGLSFRYQWCSGDQFGFVRRSTLTNLSGNDMDISVLDGLQNILPSGVPCDLQNSTSNLVDAYKRSELLTGTGLGIYALSAIIVDKAEPSEALKANMVWSAGLENPKYLLSTRQLNDFRMGFPLQTETDVKAEKGAYFVHAEVLLPSKTGKEWLIVANVNQDHSSLIALSQSILNDKSLVQRIHQDIATGTNRLMQLVAAADGLQCTGDELRQVRHYSNTLFNIMRGGIFDNNYQIGKKDFCDYLYKANKGIYAQFEKIVQDLPPVVLPGHLQEMSTGTSHVDFQRLCLEYLPLKFSRRHGDPTRPWNKFSINIRKEDGSKILDYEGNWRDIFQNWEALALSYPAFLQSMICKFLNASTFDGYNPYRITKDGFDWEVMEPDNPWSYIGYWGDHQIIYLLKLLELMDKHYPGKLESLFNAEFFVYANLPYRIKSYPGILSNPKDTIVFDPKADQWLRAQRDEQGADGTLLCDESGNIHHVTFMEKMLASLLAKLSNFIPGGGIWMNTQRPEWNDANNALVGNGVSMVTSYYLRRFLRFLTEIVEHSEAKDLMLSVETAGFFNEMANVWEEFGHLLKGRIDDRQRRKVLDKLGQAASGYRSLIYKQAFSGRKSKLSKTSLQKFLNLSLGFIDHTIKTNRRSDNLYHAYNLMTVINDDEMSISPLSEMLEGQVAVLSSGYLSSTETLQLLDGLKASRLYREDQNSYLLYPDKQLPLFLEKNNLTEETVSRSGLLQHLIRSGNRNIIEKDIRGVYHFNGNFRNVADLQKALHELSETMPAGLVEKEVELISGIFEEVFNHKMFTGRSGTFFAYEGLGSIYWHMVSKLQLAVQECCLKAIRENEHPEIINRLINHYDEINEGIGVHKPPSLYGAFPTDPYSHTPAGKGARQPGMTGQVKEDILCRFGELGVFTERGKLCFQPRILREIEFLKKPAVFEYFDVFSIRRQLDLAPGTLGFTCCQVPVVYQLSEKNGLKIVFSDHPEVIQEGMSLDEKQSEMIFNRTGEIIRIDAWINRDDLMRKCT